MQMTAHKTRSLFERYKIVSECDLVEAAKKLNAIQQMVQLKPDATIDHASHADSDPHGPATTKPRIGEVGHNLGTVAPQNDSRRSISPDFFGKIGGAARN
jgi:hypothetical protein